MSRSSNINLIRGTNAVINCRREYAYFDGVHSVSFIRPFASKLSYQFDFFDTKYLYQEANAQTKVISLKL